MRIEAKTIRKVSAGFEVLKWYVAGNPLSWYYYKTLGLFPSKQEAEEAHPHLAPLGEVEGVPVLNMDVLAKVVDFYRGTK